jgi:hypothetical protein
MRITYLEEGYIQVELKNNSGQTIEIRNVLCRFRTEEGLERYEPSTALMLSIKPHNLSPRIQIPFAAKLSLTEATNSYSVVVKYRKLRSSKFLTVTFPSKYMIIDPVRPVERFLFVSHKDPQDSGLAAKLNHYLMKIGFKGYLAEEEKRPGLDIWLDKIIPAIGECIALIVIWTSNAAIDSANMLREIEYAQKIDKKLIFLLEEGVSLPKILPKDKEFVRIPHNMSEADFVDVVSSIEHTYRTGGYESR